MRTPNHAGFGLAILTALAGVSTSAYAHHNVIVDATRPPGLSLVAELAPTNRNCIPGAHELGRIRRLPGIAATSARPWAYNRNVDAYPHCRYDSQADANRAAARGE